MTDPLLPMGRAAGAGQTPRSDERDPPPLAQNPARLLEQVAGLLRRPPASFLAPEPQDAPPAPGVDPAETLELVRLFLRVRDPAGRARCLAAIRAEVARA